MIYEQPNGIYYWVNYLDEYTSIPSQNNFIIIQTSILYAYSDGRTCSTLGLSLM